MSSHHCDHITARKGSTETRGVLNADSGAGYRRPATPCAQAENVMRIPFEDGFSLKTGNLGSEAKAHKPAHKEV